jgi:uncharacterized membrane protein (TIGR02234 family)
VTSAVPHPRARTGSAPAAVRGGRRSLAAALLLGSAGAAVALLATRQGWAEGTAAVAGGSVPLTADGSDVTGVPAALAVVGLASLVAVFAVRRAGRLLVAGLLALCGAGTVAAAALGSTSGPAGSALDEKAARVSGDTAATVEALSHTAWPYVALAGGVLLLLAGLLALRYGRSWPGMSGRYERDGSPRPRAVRPVDPDRPEDLWKAIDRGEDPTAHGA